jgi:hypothetical protein
MMRRLLPDAVLSRRCRQRPLLRRSRCRHSRSWSRVPGGVVLRVIGAVQYGTSQVFSKIVPHCAAQEWRPYLHHVMAVCSKTGQEGV